MGDKNEVTLKEFIQQRFDHLEDKINLKYDDLDRRVNENSDKVTENTKTIISIDKRTIVISVIMGIFFNGLLGLSEGIFQRLMQ